MTKRAPKPKSATATWYGDASVSATGGMNLPADARGDLGLERGGKVLVFGEPGRLILTPAPIADELLAFAAERAASPRSDT
jgi:bifunctional DNA-binding transcriptional regulator/antitoxin component of YhaV-PrlF toxin-antitoxin module